MSKPFTVLALIAVLFSAGCATYYLLSTPCCLGT
jgi:hypothetical protein